MTDKSKQHETTPQRADEPEQSDEPDVEKTDEQAPESIAQEGATAFNTERAQQGPQGATTVRGRQTDWGVDYDHPELSGMGEARDDTARDWDAAQPDAAPEASADVETPALDAAGADDDTDEDDKMPTT